MILREYQTKTIDMLFQYLNNNAGFPVLNLPTGSGKSVIIASICNEVISAFRDARIIVLAHVKELIEQNYSKMIAINRNVSAGIYSAGLKKKNMSESITFASIQSIAKSIGKFGKCDLLIIDEAHLINHKEQGTYRQLIDKLLTSNKDMRVVGLTATPYRLGHGLITDKPALFDEIIEPVTIEELQLKGYLAKLKSKSTIERFDLKNVRKRSGEYIESELQKAVDVSEKNESIVREIIERSENRKHWLVFCTGIEHAKNISQCFNRNGMTANYITGNSSNRDELITDFKNGKIQALCNVDVLTTGFDFPDIDLIAMLRPTMSPSLYMQIVGRGLRIKSHIDNCLILDFAGNIEQHGTIHNVVIPKKKGEGEGIPPSKECPECMEIVPAQVKKCPECGYIFPIEAKDDDIFFRNDDINGVLPKEMAVEDMQIMEHTSKKTGIEMLKVKYYGGLSDPVIDEYLCINHTGYAKIKADIALNELKEKGKPKRIFYKKENRFYKIISKEW